MEIKREPVDPSDLRIRQLRARDMLRDDLDAEELERYVEEQSAHHHARARRRPGRAATRSSR